MSFDLDKFTAELSVELLNLGKKTDLLNLAKHYKLSEIKSSVRKHEIKNILVQYFRGITGKRGYLHFSKLSGN